MILQNNYNNDLDSQNQFKRELSNDSHRKYHKQNVTTVNLLLLPTISFVT